jgi:hypothetical protein
MESVIAAMITLAVAQPIAPDAGELAGSTDKAQARKWFERSIQSGGWPAFGFIVSEAELRRLR